MGVIVTLLRLPRHLSVASMLFLQSPYYNPAHDLANTHFEFQMMAVAIFPIYETTLAATGICLPLNCISLAEPCHYPTDRNAMSTPPQTAVASNACHHEQVSVYDAILAAGMCSFPRLLLRCGMALSLSDGWICRRQHHPGNFTGSGSVHVTLDKGKSGIEALWNLVCLQAGLNVVTEHLL
jgi:hypothetical protein